MRSVQGQESVKLLFKLRTGSAGLPEDKKRCRTVSDERCVMYDSDMGEDVAHFLVGCEEFERYRMVLLDDLCRIVGAREWLDEFCRVDTKGKMALLGKGVAGICNRVMEKVGSALCIGWSDDDRQGSNCCMVKLLVLLSLSTSLSL